MEGQNNMMWSIQHFNGGGQNYVMWGTQRCDGGSKLRVVGHTAF